jgi:hypothetical protein
MYAPGSHRSHSSCYRLQKFDGVPSVVSIVVPQEINNFRFETKFIFSFSGVSSRMLLMHYEVSYLLFMHLSVDIINICQGILNLF